MNHTKAGNNGIHQRRNDRASLTLSQRLALLVCVVGSLCVAETAAGQTVRDEFDAISYSGNNGPANWTGNWIEVGESNGPDSGFLRVVSGGWCTTSNCMRLGYGNGQNDNTYLYREADLTGATTATFTYDFETRQANRGVVHVEVSGNGGGTWTTLATYDLGDGNQSGSESFDISAFITSDTQVRFRGTNVDDDPSQNSDFRGYLHFDDIQIAISAPSVLCPGATVSTTVDSTTGGSLRACIIWANGNSGTDTLTVPAGTYTLTLAGTGENAAATGDLDITDDIVINGDAVAATIIDANGIDRVFEILAVSATFSNVTIRNGNVTGEGGGIAVSAAASATLSATTLSGNTATNGGGITSAGTIDLTNVTMSGNTADRGGGLSCLGPCTLTNVSVTANTAMNTGGGVRQRTGSGSITFLNAIVANNISSGDADCNGNPARLISNGNNLSSDASCDFTSAGDQENTDPLLGPLQDNGGPTFTHALLTGSPAIDAGTNIGCSATDQRGIARPVGTNCDIGAYEAGAAVPLALSKTAFWLDGTPIPSGVNIPSGVEFKYLLYVNNPSIARTDVTVRDALDPAFQYQTGTIQVDNSVAECALAACTAGEELAIFTAADGAAFISDALDGDVGNYTGASSSVDAGDGNVANQQLDINANAVWALLFSVKML